MFAYDIVFETLNHGRTIGKQAAGIRVVGPHGEPVRFLASAVRNIARILDFLPVFYLVGTISIIATAARPTGRRPRGRHDRDARPLPGHGAACPRRSRCTPAAVATWDVSAIGADEVQAVRQFLDRRLELRWPARNYFAVDLANRLGPKVAGIPPNSHPEYVLEGIVVAKQGRMLTMTGVS